MMLAREEFFDCFWQEFEETRHPSVILHSWKDLPEKIDSDVDFAVSGVEPDELQCWLVEFSEKNGWRLVQVIEHEPRALYMVCIQAEAPFDAIALDVTWDYRRLGHILVPSFALMANRWQPDGKSFHVPSPGAEFCYVLAKAAAKGKAFSGVAPRLKELLEEDRMDCFDKAGQVLGIPFEPRAGSMDELAQWFETAECFRNVRGGRRFGLGEVMMYIRRIFRPTGVWLALSMECVGQVDNLVEILSPLFRKVEVVERAGITKLVKARMKMIRARAVIERPGGWSGVLPGRRVVGGEGDELVKTVIEMLSERIRKRIV